MEEPCWTVDERALLVAATAKRLAEEASKALCCSRARPGGGTGAASVARRKSLASRSVFVSHLFVGSSCCSCILVQLPHDDSSLLFQPSCV